MVLSCITTALLRLQAQAVQLQSPWGRLPFMDFARQGRHFPFWQDPSRLFPPLPPTQQQQQIQRDALIERFAQVSSKLSEITDR